ncbi:unnamed protein product [Fusarium venenatum]|uniref:Uncharacterized protein n=1 Tax=Fusarium venenatum TaxID=56646 RepID=A0A2L2TU15_9HYPO|nr:uncharacterized protein FVRRES_09174 [Fusarium venenatum]CEI69097.1 unnamed protein product [Fusarium venenatum]
MGASSMSLSSSPSPSPHPRLHDELSRAKRKQSSGYGHPGREANNPRAQTRHSLTAERTLDRTLQYGYSNGLPEFAGGMHSTTAHSGTIRGSFRTQYSVKRPHLAYHVLSAFNMVPCESLSSITLDYYALHHLGSADYLVASSKT